MASRGINKVILVGTLGADPETRYTASGSAITNMRLATNESWTDKQTGQKQERTEWHRVKMFGRLAEIAAEYLRKGKQVYIEGSLRTDKYTDKDGIERYSTDIIANDLQMLGGAGSEDSAGRSGGSSRAGGERPSRQSTPVSGRQAGGTSGSSRALDTTHDSQFEDDIPFDFGREP